MSSNQLYEQIMENVKHKCSTCESVHAIKLPTIHWYVFWSSLNTEEKDAVKSELNKYAKSIEYEDWRHYSSRNPEYIDSKYPKGTWYPIYKKAYKNI